VVQVHYDPKGLTRPEIAPPSEPISETEPSGTEELTRTANALPPAQPYSATPASGDGDDLVGEVADPQVIPLKRPWYTADRGRGHLPSEASSMMGSRYRQEQVPSSLLYFKSEPSGEGWPTRAGERPAPWTLPQNLIDEARVLADGRIPLPEPERVPWDVLIAQAVNWDIPERLAA
jgi:hypothetical protein